MTRSFARTRSFLLAQDAVRRLKEDTAAATQTAELGAALAHVHGDAKKAANLIGLTREEWLDRYPEVRGSADWEIVLSALRERRPFRDFLRRESGVAVA